MNRFTTLIAWAEFTHPGGRQPNEDRCGARINDDGSRACFVIADGLGGYAGGETAAAITMESILDCWTGGQEKDLETLLRDMVLAAHQAVREHAGSSPQLRDMRSTCAILVFREKEVGWAHVGDSRIYQFQGSVLMAQTADHSVPRMLADMGEIPTGEIRGHPDANRLLRCLGGAEPPKPSIKIQETAFDTGTWFLLCTDGFWGLITETEMSDAYRPDRPVRELMQVLAVEALGRVTQGADNLTALVIGIGFPEENWEANA